MKPEIKIFYLSFSDPGKWHGAGFFEGEDSTAAIKQAWKAKQNPGGSVMAVELSPDQWQSARPFLNRLLDLATIRDLFGPTVSFQAVDPGDK